MKINEGVLYPTVGLTGNVNNSVDPAEFGQGRTIDLGIADGTSHCARSIKAAPNTRACDRRKSSSASRNCRPISRAIMARSNVVNFWGPNQNSVGILRADRAQVQAAEVALEGVREEAKVGQRTTLDVLNAQQTLLQARVQLVQDQHDQVVYSYDLLAAVGRLSIQTLGIAVADTIRGFTSIRSRTSGSACERPTASRVENFVNNCSQQARVLTRSDCARDSAQTICGESRGEPIRLRHVRPSSEPARSARTERRRRTAPR